MILGFCDSFGLFHYMKNSSRSLRIPKAFLISTQIKYISKIKIIQNNSVFLWLLRMVLGFCDSFGPFHYIKNSSRSLSKIKYNAKESRLESHLFATHIKQYRIELKM